MSCKEKKREIEGVRKDVKEGEIMTVKKVGEREGEGESVSEREREIRWLLSMR